MARYQNWFWFISFKKGPWEPTRTDGTIDQTITTIISLEWRHNKRDSVSNHQRLDCLHNRLFSRRSKKTSKLCVTGICVRNSPVIGGFPSQRASNAENVSIWWRHHLVRKICTGSNTQLKSPRYSAWSERRSAADLSHNETHAPCSQTVNHLIEYSTAPLTKPESHILCGRANLATGPRFNIRTVFPRYGDSHVKDKTVSRDRLIFNMGIPKRWVRIITPTMT